MKGTCETCRKRETCKKDIGNAWGLCWTDYEPARSWYYGMRLRGFSPYCQPLEGLLERLDDTEGARPDGGRYHDILRYNRQLTDQELRDFELDFIREAS